MRSAYSCSAFGQCKLKGSPKTPCNHINYSNCTFLCNLKITSHKPVRCTRQLLKIKSKLILISFTFFVEYVFFFFFQNVVGKMDKETLRIRFRIDPTFWFKKITKKIFTIG